VASLRPADSLPLLPPLLHLTYVQNTGAAFGLFKGWSILFVGISAVVIVWIMWEFATRLTSLSPLTVWGSAFVLGGAVGNLLDRVRLGYVIDFLDLRVWPVFNVGDCAITIGIGLLLLHGLPKKVSDTFQSGKGV